MKVILYSPVGRKICFNDSTQTASGSRTTGNAATSNPPSGQAAAVPYPAIPANDGANSLPDSSDEPWYKQFFSGDGNVQNIALRIFAGLVGVGVLVFGGLKVFKNKEKNPIVSRPNVNDLNSENKQNPVSLPRITFTIPEPEYGRVNSLLVELEGLSESRLNSKYIFNKKEFTLKELQSLINLEKEIFNEVQTLTGKTLTDLDKQSLVDKTSRLEILREKTGLKETSHILDVVEYVETQLPELKTFHGALGKDAEITKFISDIISDPNDAEELRDGSSISRFEFNGETWTADEILSFLNYEVGAAHGVTTSGEILLPPRLKAKVKNSEDLVEVIESFSKHLFIGIIEENPNNRNHVRDFFEKVTILKNKALDLTNRSKNFDLEGADKKVKEDFDGLKFINEGVRQIDFDESQTGVENIIKLFQSQQYSNLSLLLASLNEKGLEHYDEMIVFLQNFEEQYCKKS